MERPVLSAQLCHELKQSCVLLVNMTNPPEPEDEPDHRELLRKFEAERKAKYVAQLQHAEAKSMKAELGQIKQEKGRSKSDQTNTLKKEQPPRYSTRRPRHASENPLSNAAPRHYVPKDPMGRHKPSESQSKSAEAAHAIVSEPVLPPVHAPIVERATQEEQRQVKQQQQAEAQVLGQIRLSMHMRPKTSAAACIDYDDNGQDTFSSKSTSRSASEYATVHGRPTSTGLTSLQAMTPSMIDGRASRKDRRPSEVESASGSMKEIQELARQRADEYVRNKERGSRPGSRASKLSRMTSRSDINGGRSSSRAGSIASSIADGISNYIRPRGNSTGGEGSIRSGRSSSLGFSSQSRSSSMSRRSSFGNGGWWRNGGLRRRGSWASFRSGGDDRKGRNKLRKDGGPNLNRPLPALPGLDQYRETKTHIGQLVKSSGKKKVKKHKIGVPQPLIPPDTPYTATLPPPSRSHSNLGYHANSAPLPEDDGTEKQFPRYDPSYHHQHHQPHAPQPPQTERRSTHPQDIHTQSAQAATRKASKPEPGCSGAKLKRSSLNPIRPRRGSGGNIISLQNHDPQQQRNPHPLIIRGSSYTKELQSGVFPRRMERNEGTCHVTISNQNPNQDHEQQEEQGDVGNASGGMMTALPSRERCEDWERKEKGLLKGRIMGRMLGAGGGGGGGRMVQEVEG